MRQRCQGGYGDLQRQEYEVECAGRVLLQGWKRDEAGQHMSTEQVGSDQWAGWCEGDLKRQAQKLEPWSLGVPWSRSRYAVAVTVTVTPGLARCWCWQLGTREMQCLRLRKWHLPRVCFRQPEVPGPSRSL